jgi:hypothetical protein
MKFGTHTHSCNNLLSTVGKFYKPLSFNSLLLGKRRVGVWFITFTLISPGTAVGE